MSCTSQVENITIEPVNPVWGRAERTCVNLVADVASSLEDTYFEFETVDPDEVVTEYYCWYDAGSGVDPALAGKTAVPVVIAPNDSASVIAGLTTTALDALGELNAVQRAESVLMENSYLGAVTATVDGAAPTGFTFDQLSLGSKLVIGLTEDIVFSTSELLLDVTASQLGAEVATRLRQGNEVGPLSINMKEGTLAKLQEIIQVGGSSYTPGGGTEVVGFGRAKSFTNVIGDAGRLILHPTRKAASDLTEDICVWKAYPNLSEITFSGESEKLVNVEFTAYQDEFVVDEVSKYVYGDWNQNFLK